MLSTVFMFLMVFWAIALVFHLSGMVIPMVLVLTVVVLLLKLIIRRTSFIKPRAIAAVANIVHRTGVQHHHRLGNLPAPLN